MATSRVSEAVRLADSVAEAFISDSHSRKGDSFVADNDVADGVPQPENGFEAALPVAREQDSRDFNEDTG